MSGPSVTSIPQNNILDLFASILLESLSGVRNLIDVNANEDRWVWNSESRQHWKLAGKDCGSLVAGFRTAQIFVQDGSAGPFQSVDIAPIHGQSELVQASILVRPCYHEAIAAVCLQALTSRSSGIIITGQPGTGKSLFIWYLLVCLLGKNQVVLLNVEARRPILFYRGRVYTAQSSEHLPQSSTAFVWSLPDPFTTPPPGSTAPMMFPVQAASPDAGLYSEWRTAREPLLTAIPLWSREELMEGYNCMRHHLPFCLTKLPSGRIKLRAAFPRFERDLQVLTEKCGKIPSWREFSPSAAGALDTLIDALIHHFGFVARDVCYGLFDFSTVEDMHLQGTPFRCDTLTDGRDRYLCSKSDLVFCIVPRSKIEEPFRWELEFKSPVIATRVVEQLEGQDKARETLAYVLRHPGGNAHAAIDPA